MIRSRSIAVLCGLALAGGAVTLLPTGANADHGERARATLRLADGQRAGSVIFYGDERSVTEVSVTVRLPRRLHTEMAGFHGFHVHANDDPANGQGCRADPAQPRSTWFVSADGHLAEAGQGHGAHSGDLPPLLVTAAGRAYSVSITDRMDVDDVVGRAVVLHVGADNLGNIPVGTGPTEYTPNDPVLASDLTRRTGNAGDRLACGVVGPR